MRLLYIDLTRALAVLLVTAFHTWRPLGKPSIDIFGVDLMSPIANGEIGVEIFFMISGYCMAISASRTHNYKDYIYKRIIRIVPAYYAAIIFWNIAVSFGFSEKTNGLIDNLTHFLFVHNLNENTFFSISGVFWSIAVEAQFYLLLPLLLPLITKKSYAALTIFVLFSLGINMLFTSKTLTWSIFSYLPLFFLGGIMGLYPPKTSSYKGLICLFLGISLLFVRDVENEFLDILVAALIVSGIIFLREFFERRSSFFKPFAWIGLISYSVYLYNYCVYFPMQVFKGIYVIEWIVPIATAIAFGAISFYFIEKPSLNLRKVFLKKEYQKRKNLV